MSGYYVDMSVWNPPQIDWQAYKVWASQWDGVSRVAIRSTYGTGYTDKNYAEYRTGAEKAGIERIFFYHYSYPQFNTAQAEANYQKQIVGTIRASDLLMLDMEEQVTQATSEWCLEWLKQQESNYSRKPLVYANQSYVQSRLQALSLARYPLILARWGNITMPPCPLPWASYAAIQLSDNATSIPGIAGKVDLNMWL